MQLLEDYIYCEVHGECHEPNGHPYNGPPTIIKDAKPIWFYLDAEGVKEMEPECYPEDWRKIWIGAYIKSEKEDNH